MVLIVIALLALVACGEDAVAVDYDNQLDSQLSEIAAQGRTELDMPDYFMSKGSIVFLLRAGRIARGIALNMYFDPGSYQRTVRAERRLGHQESAADPVTDRLAQRNADLAVGGVRTAVAAPVRAVSSRAGTCLFVRSPYAWLLSDSMSSSVRMPSQGDLPTAPSMLPVWDALPRCGDDF